MTEKHTKRDLFTTLLVFATAAAAEDWVIRGLEHEIELLDRKHGASNADAKRKAEQGVIKHDLLNGLAAGFETATTLAEYAQVTVQRATAMLTQLSKDGSVIREQNGKRVTFRLAD